FQGEGGIGDWSVTGVQTCAVPIWRELTLESGGTVRYDKLVIATGARCDAMGIAGVQQPHVFSLHTLQDAAAMREFLREKQPRRRSEERRVGKESRAGGVRGQSEEK